jgi:hypothetical protein
MMSATVSLSTVSISVAAALAGGLAAAVWTQRRTDRREDVRWQRERDDRQAQWRREDQLRWLQDRQQAYARLMAALYEWDQVLLSSIASRHNDVALKRRTELDTAERIRASRVAREALPLVQFMAPQTVRSQARRAITDRESFWIVYLTPDPPDQAKIDAGWTRLTERISLLREAMRNDLGLESESEDIGQRPGA